MYDVNCSFCADQNKFCLSSQALTFLQHGFYTNVENVHIHHFETPNGVLENVFQHHTDMYDFLFSFWPIGVKADVICLGDVNAWYILGYVVAKS